MLTFNDIRPKILILADDLTGAAEVGGIAFQLGLTVRIVLGKSKTLMHLENVIIIDTNTRSMDPEDAHKEVKRILNGINFSLFDLVFKKVDSILRGSIATEIKALLDKMKMDSALLVPVNPSKRRVIEGGIYYIDGVPINKTYFRLDPQYPRVSKYIKELIIDSNHPIITAYDSDHESQIKIIIPDIASEQDLRSIVQRFPESGVLPAGGSDFLKEILSSGMILKRRENLPQIKSSSLKHFIIGSNSETGRKTVRLLRKKNFSVFRLPASAITNQKQFDKWTRRVLLEVENNNPVVVSGPYRKVEDHHQIAEITGRLITITKMLVEKIPVSTFLFISGGETARRFFRLMEWNDLRISGVFETGVVSLNSLKSKLKVVVKPGSYEWPAHFLEVLKYSDYRKQKGLENNHITASLFAKEKKNSKQNLN